MLCRRDVLVWSFSARDPKRSSDGYTGRTSASMPPKSFPRELRATDAVSVQHLVVVHRDNHLVELSGECERAFVVRDRRAAIASNVEAAPGYEVEEAKP